VAYTLEFKLEALRRFKAQPDGKLGSAANGKPITPEQMGNFAAARGEPRLKMKAEILKKPPRTLRRSRCEVRVH